MPSLLTAVRDLERLRQIAGVLVRHGFGELVQRAGWGAQLGVGAEAADAGAISMAQRIRLVLTELGPSFVKLGQILSTRPDLLPADIIEELQRLQDEVPPVAFELVKPVLERELGGTLEDIYEFLDPTPLASASIAQVHRARLRMIDGPAVEVVVKLQRPNIRDIIDRDLDLLHWMARAFESSIPESRLYAPTRLVSEFERAITSELDFTLEADNADKFRRNFVDFEAGIVAFPKVYRQASSRRVLTLEFLAGRKVLAAVEQGADGEKIAKHAVAIMIKQVFEDGFFHADPHPGNIIIQGTNDHPIIAMIDLGLVGRLTPQLRDKTVDLMVAAASEDYRAMADALFAIGTPTKKIDRREFDAEVAILADKYLGKKLKDIQLSGLLRDLIDGSQKYGIEPPADFVLVGKALMTVEGIGKQIYPELDVFDEVKPYFLRLVWMRYSPEKMSQELVRGMSRLGGAAADMPLQLAEIFEDLRRGDLAIRTIDRELPGALDRLGRRIFSGLVVSVCILSGAYLVAQHQRVLGTTLLSVGALWATSHSALVAWLGRKRKQ
ncbi:MAG: Ubiquinone biosynthesis monooxygenase UbiB [Myxococcaceae bacterium]|nr:Ubiquinone biosynthesis monooxygenase UbiB [Myxococcaceae bacterium]